MSEEKKETKIECRLCRKQKVWLSPYNKWQNEISDWSKICTACEALWELGKKTMAATKADGKETEARVFIDVPTDPQMGEPKGPVEVRGKDIMAAMGGVSLRGTALGDRWAKGDKNIIKITESQDERDHYYISGGGTLQFKVPKARAEAMQRVVAAFYNAIAKARVDGFNEGRNLLYGLAKGKVALDDFTEQCDNTRVGKKPRRVMDE